MAFKYNIFSALTKVSELEKDNASLLARLSESEDKVHKAEDAIEKFLQEQKTFNIQIDKLKFEHVVAMDNLKSEYQSKIDSLTKELKDKVESLEAQLNSEKESATKKAHQILASIGVEPEAVKVSVKPTEGDIVGRFQSLSGKEKHDYYEKHKEVILKAAGLIK